MSELTKVEQANVMAALRILRARCGTATALATGLGLNQLTVRIVMNEQRPPSANFAIRAARLAGVPVDDVLSGAYPPPGTCPHCGHRVATFTDEQTTP